MQPVIAVVGSANPSRRYDPPVREHEAALAAAAELGAELAERGCRLTVYSSDPCFIEHAVVRGYVESGRARPRSVVVRGRFGSDIGFRELEQHPDLFAVAPDPTPDWEVAYYRSLLAVDGVVLLGGERSTFIAGLIALSRRIAVAPVATFGGGAEKVWRRLGSEPGLATEDEVAVLSQPWKTATSAAEVVGSLLTQHERRQARDAANGRADRAVRRRAAVGTIAAVLLLLATLASIPIAFALPNGTWPTLSILFVAPVLASTWGAVVRNIYDGAVQWLRAAALGSAAGTIAFLLFLAAQLSTNPAMLSEDGSRRLVLFAVIVGFIGGFTSEVVYRKLREQDVAQTSVLPPPGG